VKSTKLSSIKAAKAASSLLLSGRTSKTAKELAGSVLAQSRSSKATSPEMARKAARVLADPNSTRSAKTLAASVLTRKNKDVFLVKSFRVAGGSLSQAERTSAVRKVAAKK